MATSLTAGQSYSLSSSMNDKVSVVFVKLTDSSLRSIDEYHVAKSTKRMATISFSSTIGVISIPQKDSESARTFDFAIQKPNSEEIHECLFQTKNKLTSLGTFTKKLQIQGTDDIYSSTKQKISQAEEESKKQRAKEIKTTGTNRCKKMLRNSKGSLSASGVRSRPLSATSMSAAVQRKQTSVNAQPKVTPASRTAALASVQNERTSPYSGGSGNSSGSSSQRMTSAAKDALSAISFPLRDRIVHLLAIKNYKKPELMLKLQQDGIHDKDRDSITAILDQVAQLNARDNSYSLQRLLYASEVQNSWPLFSESDRQLLSKKVTSMCLNSSVMNPRTISPCPSNGSQGSPPRTKRSAETVEPGAAHSRPNSALEIEPPAKKVRIAHNAKRDAPRSAAQAPTLQNGTPPTATSLGPAGATKAATDSSDAIFSSSDDTSELNDEDFLREFTPIESREQRSEYKACFESGHKEHQLVYNRISQKTAQLNQLKELLDREDVGTPQHDALLNEIFAAYLRLTSNPEYTRDKSRYEYLCRKLGHIKKLVQNYDKLKR